MKYIDIHCHLDSADYDIDRQEVLARMRERETGAITIGTDLESSKKAIEIAEESEKTGNKIWACIGVHPENVVSGFPSPEQPVRTGHPGGGEGQGGVLGRKELEKKLATEGARLFAHILPEWLIGAIDPIMQNEDKATYCKKINKEDGELKIDLKKLPEGKEAHQALLKIKAFEDWPTAYFFLDTPEQSEGGLQHDEASGEVGSKQKKRIIITDATIDPSTGHSTVDRKSVV